MTWLNPKSGQTKRARCEVCLLLVFFFLFLTFVVSEYQPTLLSTNTPNFLARKNEQNRHLYSNYIFILKLHLRFLL